ncbi:MAG: hypothetical protein WAN47_00360 [Nitrosotalea sp.]
MIVEDNRVKILCDPWMVNDEYFGSWGIYPPMEFKPKDFDDIVADSQNNQNLIIQFNTA